MTPLDGRPLLIGAFVATFGLGLAATSIAGSPPWAPIANSGTDIPGTNVPFRSFNQPSVNRDGLVVFRARGGGQGQPLRGIYTRDMSVMASSIDTIAARGDLVPWPNNTSTPPEGGELASFLEFPSFARIDANSDRVATRAQHEPVWTWSPAKGEETRVGTAGVFVHRHDALETAASLLGAVLDPKTSDPVFPEYSVPGMPEGTRFDQFPGAPSMDGDIVGFKGNFTDPTTLEGKTGVYWRDLSGSGDGLTHRVASSDTIIPTSPKEQATTFGSTAPPSIAGGDMVFVGLDIEEAPTMGGLYLAPLEDDPDLIPIILIGDSVPGEPEGAMINRIGEGLSFDGRYVSFWAAWGEETRTETLTCPEDGNPLVIAYCQEQHPDGFEVEIPVHQGIFVHDLETGETIVAAKTSDVAGGIEDFLFWNFSGHVPGEGGGDEGDETEEYARWRSAAFSAVTSSSMAVAPGESAEGFTVVWKASLDGVDAIQMRRGSIDEMPPIGVITTAMPGTLVDPTAPAGSTITVVGIEREALRGDWFVVAASMFDEATGESWAGIYQTSAEDVQTCTGDLNGDAVVGSADLGLLLAAWGDCPGMCPEDLDGDHEVRGSDLGVLLLSWGQCW